MILIFDYFETLVHNKSMDFNRGLKVMWELRASKIKDNAFRFGSSKEKPPLHPEAE